MIIRLLILLGILATLIAYYLTSIFAYDGRSEYDVNADGYVTLADVGIVLAAVGTRQPTCEARQASASFWTIHGRGWDAAGEVQVVSWHADNHDQSSWYHTEGTVYAGGYLWAGLGSLAFTDGPGTYKVRITQGSLVCRVEFVVDEGQGAGVE